MESGSYIARSEAAMDSGIKAATVTGIEAATDTASNLSVQTFSFHL